LPGRGRGPRGRPAAPGGQGLRGPGGRRPALPVQRLRTGTPLHSKALTIREPAARITGSPAEGYPSGQRGQTVNLLAYAFGGLHPPPSTTFAEAATVSQGGSSSMIAPQTSKLIMRVRFPSPAPLDWQATPKTEFRSFSSVGRALPW